MINYNEYVQCVNDNLKLDPLNWSFKSDVRYTWVLEHVSSEQGYKYLECIKNEFGEFYNNNKEKLIEFSCTNDFLGRTIKTSFRDFCECSPTNLRYIYHGLLALQHTKYKYNEAINIVEIGGGYGGLCYFIYKLAELQNIPIASYTIFDLPVIIDLQKKYLSVFKIDINTYSLYDNFILINNSYFISNYAFTEIADNLRKEYQEKVISYCNHGFVVWNHLDNVYNFTTGGTLSIEHERPQTAYQTRNNLFVKF
jgi:hypothetical protein